MHLREHHWLTKFDQANLDPDVLTAHPHTQHTIACREHRNCALLIGGVQGIFLVYLIMNDSFGVFGRGIRCRKVLRDKL